MLSRRLTHLLGVLAISLGCFACSDKAPTAPIDTAKQAEIIAVNAPLHYFTVQLAANLAKVSILAPAEGDPAEWLPSIDEALRLQQAELIILNGAGYSKWLDKVAISHSKLVNTSQAFSQQYIPLTDQATHSHGPSAEHSHRTLATTTWMDLHQALQQAQAIARALEKHWPEEAQAIRQREVQLSIELTKLDQAYKEQARQLAGKTLIYSHPVYQYFERRYLLPGTSLHWEPDEFPSESEWLKLKYMLGNTENTVLIWEGHPNTEIKARMREIGLMNIVIKPGAKKERESWLIEQIRNIKRLTECCAVS